MTTTELARGFRLFSDYALCASSLAGETSVRVNSSPSVLVGVSHQCTLSLVWVDQPSDVGGETSPSEDDLTSPSSNGETANSLYFSWDAGLVHYVSISTEIWFGVGDGKVTLQTQLDWLKKDLAAANENREAVPWVVVQGHRSVYSK